MSSARGFRILHLASEAVPFFKTGGLADVVGSLAPEQAKMGAQVFVILPKYQQLNETIASQLEFVCHFDVYLSWRRQYVGVYRLVKDKVTYYFLDNEYYFARSTLYGQGDDGERFGYFTIAAMELIARMQLRVNIVHLHDWHVGMAPVLYHQRYCHFPFYENIKFLLTIHNPAYQGNYDKNILGNVFGLNSSCFEDGSTRFGDGISYLKSAIVYSDLITTVSPTHRDELLRGEHSYHLSDILSSRQDQFVGVLNGLDKAAYNPATDPKIAFNYQKTNYVGGKKKNKAELQKEFNLPQKNVPLFTFISRLTWQKGVDILLPALERVLDQDMQVMLIGNGDGKYEEAIQALRDRYPNQVACFIGFNDGLARRAYASADFLLMPSLFEPCGLNQLIAFSYGTLPIVRECGGLKDSVVPFNCYDLTGDGFTFSEYSVEDLTDCIKRALTAFHDRKARRALITSAFKKDVSWRKSAQLYLALYQRIKQ